MKSTIREIENFEGASGMITMQEDGMTRKTIYMKKVKDGQFVRYEE